MRVLTCGDSHGLNGARDHVGAGALNLLEGQGRCAAEGLDLGGLDLRGDLAGLESVAFLLLFADRDGVVLELQVFHGHALGGERTRRKVAGEGICLVDDLREVLEEYGGGIAAIIGDLAAVVIASHERGEGFACLLVAGGEGLEVLASAAAVGAGGRGGRRAQGGATVEVCEVGADALEVLGGDLGRGLGGGVHGGSFLVGGLAFADVGHASVFVGGVEDDRELDRAGFGDGVDGFAADGVLARVDELEPDAHGFQDAVSHEGVDLVAARRVGDAGGNFEAGFGFACARDRSDGIAVLVDENGVGGVNAALLEAFLVSPSHVVHGTIWDADGGELPGSLVDGSGVEGDVEGGGTGVHAGISLSEVVSEGRPSMSRTSSTVRNPAAMPIE